MKPSRTETSSRKLILAWLSVAVWALVIFYFSSQPSLATDWGIWDLILRKGAHVSEFAVLFLLLWRALRVHRLDQMRAVPAAATLALMYALSDELHQRFVPGRYSAVRDVGFDLAGIVLAVLAVSIKHSRRRQPAR